MADKNIENMDKDDLEEKLVSIRNEILRVVKILGKQYKNLMTWQAEREKFETRLEEIGVKLEDQK